jgi:hypothetical protein
LPQANRVTLANSRRCNNSAGDRQDGHAQDVVVADQMGGFTVPCDWAEFGQIELQPGQTVSAVQIKGATEWQL